MGRRPLRRSRTSDARLKPAQTGGVAGRQLEPLQRGQPQQLADLASVNALAWTRVDSQLAIGSTKQLLKRVDPRGDGAGFDAAHRRLRHARALRQLSLRDSGEATSVAEDV